VLEALRKKRPHVVPQFKELYIRSLLRWYWFRTVALAMPTKTVLSVLGVCVLSGLGNAEQSTRLLVRDYFWTVIGRLVQLNLMDTVCISIHQEQVHIAHGDRLFLKSRTWHNYAMVTDKYWDPTYVIYLKVTLEHVHLLIMFYY